MRLNREQLDRFERDGYLAPLEFCTTGQMAIIRSRLDESLQCNLGPHGGDGLSARHQDCRPVYDICSSSAILDAVASVLGPDLVLWNSVFINKPPGASAIPWHQDRDYLLLNPCVNIAVWLAIDDATIENGCLQVVPGSHGHYLPHTLRTQPHEFDATADIADCVKERAVSICLKAGQFILFHNQLLHFSASNNSATRRLGLAVRYTVPGVKVNTAAFFDGYCVYTVRGNNLDSTNPVGTPPMA
jgi:hypothetical protein